MKNVWSFFNENYNKDLASSRKIFMAIQESRVANCDTNAIMQVTCSAVTPSAPESVKLTYVHYVHGTVITEQFNEFRGRRAKRIVDVELERCVCISIRMMDVWTCFLATERVIKFLYTFIYIKNYIILLYSYIL